MNRPKRASRNQLWSTLQTGRPVSLPAVPPSLEAGSPPPASAAGYLNRPLSFPAPDDPSAKHRANFRQDAAGGSNDKDRR